jgi:hypothetical protein
MSETQPPAASAPWSGVAAGAALLLASLGLVVLAGCFLIGVLGVLGHWPTLTPNSSPPPQAVVLTESDQVALRVLYAAAAACAVGALVLAVLGTAGLRRVLRSR